MELDPGVQYDKIYRYCYFRLRHTQAAEDITQETFLRYYSHGGGKPLPFLYTVAKNLCTDYFRKERRLTLDEDLPDTLKEKTPPALQLEASMDIKRAVNMLPSDLQELVLLRFVNDLKMGDIAAITGLSRFSLNRKLKTATEHLKKYLKED